MAPFSPNAREVSGDYLTTLVKRTTSHNFPISQLRQRELSHRITERAHPLAPRAEHESNPVQPSRGIVNPSSINMGGLMALFAIIGAAFVLAGIWFFFWAKNGGFVWRKGDWEEYKSTVLRRKDSDGRTLSNATKSTALGGGSVVGKGYGDYHSSTNAATTVDGSVVSGEKPRRKGIRETAKEKLLRRRRDEEWEGGADEDMRAYRHEKPAKRQRNASGFSFTTGEDDVMTVATEEQRLHNHAPLSSGHHDSSHHHRHQHRSSHGSDAPSTSTRPRGPRPNAPAPAPAPASSRLRQSNPRKRERTAMPGSYAAPQDIASSTHGSDYTYEQVSLAEPDTGTGTRSYHHPIPGLSKGYRRTADGGRGGGGGGRGRRDSLSDSEGEDYDSRIS
ncbi:predicted protein [Histoplasma mississippiense (nom. inval.)]|uniref:predicted protein n=1 Tax=Ajellomyces capsulatus (strain NAm1 / WU24) TaxID=2059318 RepID=UPI000157C159|nr:predicted protein [Histoplasma mississippiense (nom. inval.)]EDN07338.1 predicted protein [Histoplasma mississippiense (nom. inval.)]